WPASGALCTDTSPVQQPRTASNLIVFINPRYGFAIFVERSFRPDSIDYRRHAARAAAAARSQLAGVGHTLFRTHVLVLELLPVFRIHRLRFALHGFERNAPELGRLFDERILSGPVMRHHALADPFIRDGARDGRAVDRD